MTVRNLSLFFVVGISLQSPNSFAVDRSLVSDASFTQNWQRYPSADSIINTLSSQFPKILDTANSYVFNGNPVLPSCVMESNNRAVLGEDNPINGVPTLNSPNSAFVIWYTTCARAMIMADEQIFASSVNDLQYRNPGDPVSAGDAAAIRAYAGDTTSGICQLMGVSASSGYINAQYTYASACDWKNLPPAARRAAIAEQITRFVGPNSIVKLHQLAASTDDFAAQIDAQILQAETSGSLAFEPVNVTTSWGSFEVLKAVRFLILMKDTLRY